MTKYYALKDNNGYQNIVNSWDEAKEIIKTLNSPNYKSFQKILSSLYQEDIVDADAEMKVFNSMLKADGLDDSGLNVERKDIDE